MAGTESSILQKERFISANIGDNVTLHCFCKATYVCGSGYSNVVEFGQGAILHVKGESHPGIIYTHGDRSGQCKNSTETGSPTQSCVYNLPKRNLRLSDAGTYYCAVVSCGEILFGNGTKLVVKERHSEPVLLVFYLGIALGVSFILIIVLICIIYKMNMMPCQKCRGHESQTRGLIVSQSNAAIDEGDNLQYAALNLTKKNKKLRRQRNHMEEDTTVTYAGIRLQTNKS
ncbi:hypothetical protein DPEC_G00104010 [Dallia pectoralis]|uniref:Uncharacterized protein n=1 Tax=Dallia pectoralis TaxID=75939 RepID=A0ACC2GXB0_DALPE|nr:hypothetical protein DPEC_G00104010 [Dallia pectoralis]